MTADILREKFLAFFKARKHKIIESDSLVPKDDPTVLFTPAGMNQFKHEFMGRDSGFKRAATAQRCLRTDDLEKVGKTSLHHTFFEMLGNFSFGDYFKQEAISWAWEFLTQELKISSDKLWVSVYQDDDQAYAIWKNVVKIPVNRIIRLGDKDNFWPAEAKTKGPNGPCGPCSEIFFDFGEDVGCKKSSCTPACSCGRFAEIWNLVFTQFNRKPDGSLEPLPNKNIDTGMGLERLTALMQGAKSNFETELFQPIIKEIIRGQSSPATGASAGRPGTVPLETFYAIADHVRAVVFSISDGILPSNEARGYVVRKLIRKSILHLISLGIKEPFLYRLVPIVAEIMRKAYPELTNRQEDIAQMVLAEEKNFINTLGASEELFKSKFTEFIENPNPETVGNIVFLLHDTYGIPVELTGQWLDKHKISFSEKAFQQAMGQQKARSKLGSAMQGDVFSAKGLDIKVKDTKFTGYQENSTESKILAILKDAKEVTEVLAGDNLQIVLDQTPFYAESGGQVGDTGELINGRNVFEVRDTQKMGNVILHIGKIKSGTFKSTDTLTAKIDIARRQNIARNHTATHVLQAALRKVLGNHVQQQGSLVGEEKFRFDFTHFKGLSVEEISRVEQAANSFIAKNQAINCQEMAFKDAKKAGALAFFEEKYAENVRVVFIGDISKELCAGTHLSQVSEIGLIKILSEGSVASGVRRIEGATAGFAQQFIKEQEQKAAKEAVKKQNLKESKEKEKKRSVEIKNSLVDALPRLIAKSVKIRDINVIFSLEDDLDMPALRLLADKLKEKLSCAVVVLGSQDKEQKKAFLVIAVTPDLLSRGMDAGALIRQAAPIIGGSGGGRGDFAQAGGTQPENFTLAFEQLRDIIKNSP
ncbi:MAG: alanine--tRNA ligase [Candidatus Omnitrophica bacterium]|nr:alanine--tRNA ligase [Candidatus Omnitrophota bacterium]